MSFYCILGLDSAKVPIYEDKDNIKYLKNKWSKDKIKAYTALMNR